jgi:hypothetical protein
MLIVGVPETMGSIGIGSLRARVDQLLLRLRARYPDRGLVIAATLADAASRLLARRALQLADAGLFLLCPSPLAETLAAQPNQDARIDLLGLVARVERRIPLPGEGELDRWFAERAEILVQIDANPLPATIPPENTPREHTPRPNTPRQKTPREHTPREHTPREYNSAEHSASETSARSAGATARKRVRITADQGIDWNFEY